MCDTERLKLLMYDETRAAKYYSDLAARRSSVCGAAVLRHISCEESKHLRKLQAEYFIITGQSFCPCTAEVDIPCCYLDALRDSWNGENEAAAAYMSAAAETSNPRLAALYPEIAADEMHHADELAELMADAMR